MVDYAHVCPILFSPYAYLVCTNQPSMECSSNTHIDGLFDRLFCLWDEKLCKVYILDWFIFSPSPFVLFKIRKLPVQLKRRQLLATFLQILQKASCITKVLLRKNTYETEIYFFYGGEKNKRENKHQILYFHCEETFKNQETPRFETKIQDGLTSIPFYFSNPEIQQQQPLF